MILLYVISLASLVICQYMEQGVQPDLAFGQENDRFDLTGIIPKTDFRVDYEEPRRAGGLQRRRRLRKPAARRFRYPQNRREDDWDDIAELAGPRGGAEDYDIYTRAQDYRRRRRIEDLLRNGKKPEPKKPAPPAAVRTADTREIRLLYSLPIKIKVQDSPNGSYITGINIL